MREEEVHAALQECDGAILMTKENLQELRQIFAALKTRVSENTGMREFWKCILPNPQDRKVFLRRADVIQELRRNQHLEDDLLQRIKESQHLINELKRMKHRIRWAAWRDHRLGGK